MCIDLVKAFEGLKLHAYKCPAGIWTIGYGTTAGVKEGDVIDQKTAEEYLLRDLKKSGEYVIKFVKVNISQSMLDALTSFVYNIGAGNFLGSTLLKQLNKGNPRSAAGEFKRWNKIRTFGGYVVSPGLERRRKAEAELFLNGL